MIACTVVHFSLSCFSFFLESVSVCMDLKCGFCPDIAWILKIPFCFCDVSNVKHIYIESISLFEFIYLLTQDFDSVSSVIWEMCYVENSESLPSGNLETRTLDCYKQIFSVAWFGYCTLCNQFFVLHCCVTLYALLMFALIIVLLITSTRSLLLFKIFFDRISIAIGHQLCVFSRLNIDICMH